MKLSNKQKKIIPLLIVMAMLIQLFVPIFSSYVFGQSATNNINVSLIAVHDEIYSGESADFKLQLRLTGSKRKYKDVKVELAIPEGDYLNFDDSNLEDFKLDNVIPTYLDGELTYYFETLENGQIMETIIPIETKNIITKDGTELKMDVKLNGSVVQTENDKGEEGEKDPKPIEEIKDDAITKVRSSIETTLTKKFKENLTNKENTVAFPGDEVVWEIDVIIPKKEVGQENLEKVTITDELPTELQYIGMLDDGTEPSRQGNKLTWDFDIRDFGDQAETQGDLFNKRFLVKTRVNRKSPTNTWVENEAKIEVNGDKVKSKGAKDNVYIALPGEGSGEVTGSYYIPAHYGPEDENGGTGTSNANKNPVIEAYDDALLTFTATISPLRESNPGRVNQDGSMGPGNKIKDFKAYTTIYDIDNNLILENIILPRKFEFRPNSSYPTGVALEREPVFSILGKVDGKERTLIKAEDIVLGKTYSREELGLGDREKVSQVKYDFTYAPGGIYAVGHPKMQFTVSKGFVGQVENKFNVIGVDGNNGSFNHKKRYPHLYEPGGERDSAGPRQVNIIPKPKELVPVGEVGVRLLNHVNGVVKEGSNRMEIKIKHHSTTSLEGEFEAYVLMPIGVTIKEEPNASYTDGRGRITEEAEYDVVEDDYKNSGRQLVKVKWSEDRLFRRSEVTAELDVNIAENAPSRLSFDVYGFTGDEKIEAPGYDNDHIENTILQEDSDDLNANGILEEPRLKAGNQYTILNRYDIQTKKFVKSSTDDDYSRFTEAEAGSVVKYKLFLTNTTNKDLSTMTLIDVFPSPGDLGITDHIERGSKFSLEFNGDLDLPSEWEDKVNVYYSTAKKPERDDLIQDTDYPEGTKGLSNPDGAEPPNWKEAREIEDWSRINSFKIEMKDGNIWLEGVDMEINYSMTMPKQEELEKLDNGVLDYTTEPETRSAWNSFAVATDNQQPVEPERVGVSVLEKIDIPVEKKWVGKVGESAKIQLIKEIGDESKVITTKVLTKDNDWKHIFKDLYKTSPIGDSVNYSIREIDLDEDQYESKITGDQEKGFVVTNTQKLGAIKVIKVDENGERILTGAEFEIRNSHDELVQTGGTDETGEFTFEDLAFGDYKLIETKAPTYIDEDGKEKLYRLLTKPIDFTIDSHEEVKEIEVENTKSGWKLPETGGPGRILFTIIGILLMLGALLGFKKELYE